MPVQYRNVAVQDWDARCRITDAGGIDLDADAHLWLNMELDLQSLFGLHVIVHSYYSSAS